MNTPLFGVGITIDGKNSCTNCHRNISSKLRKTSLAKESSIDLLKDMQDYKFRNEEKRVLTAQKFAENKMWYDNKILLIFLFFILPPIGIYAMAKHKTVIWKKIFYIVPASLSIFLLLMIIIVTITKDDYRTAMTFYDSKNYMEAYKYFNRVSLDDENYKDAVAKLRELQPKFDSIVAEERKKEIAEINKKEVEPNKLSAEDLQNLKSFQIQWSDKILKFWQGDYITKTRVSNSSDTIYFQLKKIASTGNWQSSAEMNREIYQKEYDSLLRQNFNNKYNLVKTKIVITPDPEQQKINNAKAERQHSINKQFAGFSGANWHVENYIKDNMNDPDSYEHIETTYKDKGHYILVYTKFRGTNSFGAKIIQTAVAKVDLDGNVLSLSY